MKIKRYSLNIALAVLFLIVSRAGWGACTISNPRSYQFTLPALSFTAASNQTPGTAIGAEIVIPATTPGASVACNPKTYIYYYQRFAPSANMVASAFPGIYKTNVPGIGVKITNIRPGSRTDITVSDVSNNEARFVRSPSSFTSDGIIFFGFKIQFYVIGTVEPGTVTFPDPLIEGWANHLSTGIAGGSRFGTLTLTGALPMAPAACKTPDIRVNMNKHHKGDFPSVGSASAPVAFDFKINACDPGMTSVSYTFTPASGITLVGSGNSQYLTLDSSSTASGVGVQLLKEDGVTAIPFNSKIPFSGYNKTLGGDYTIPMKARYVRTGTISPGSANSAAEFVMSYE